jgi:diamine N-acetyltransferase
MAEVHLRRITADNEKECLELHVDETQQRFIATNAESLAQAKAYPGLVPLGVYDRAARGYPRPRVPMVGFVMYEIDCGVGSILRLMIDRAHQRKGYGRAALLELVRRLRLEPEVEMVVTSHRHDNAVVAALFRSVGFAPWELDGFALKPGEVYLRLPSGH